MKPTKYVIMTLLMAIFSMSATAQQGNALSIPDVSAKAGAEAMVPVLLANEGDVVAMEFDLTLPQGFALDTHATLSNRCDDHVALVKNMEGQTYKVLLYSPSNKALKGTDGEVMTLNMTIPEGLDQGSTHELTLQNAVLAGANGGNILTAATAGTIRIGGTPDLLVKDVTADKAKASPGERLTINWKVENIGETATGDGWTEQVSLVGADGSTSKLLATTYHEQTLAAGGIVSRSVDIELPQLLGIDGSLSVQVRIIPSDLIGEAENALANNTGKSASAIEVEKQLTLKLMPSRLTEGETSSAILVVSRSGSWNSDQTFTLTHNNDSRVELPQAITIPAGQSGERLSLSIANNDVLDSDSIVAISVEGNGYAAATATLVIEDDELPELKLTASKTVLNEGEKWQLTITLGRASAQPTEVELTSEEPGRFDFPSHVTIPSNSLAATVEVSVVDDDVPNQETSVSFVATAEKYEQGEAIVMLEDNDIPAIDLELQPNAVSEGSGPAAIMATLKRLSEANSKVTIILSDNSGGLITYPSREIVMEKGVNQVQFTVGVADNNMVDGDKTIEMTAAVYISTCGCQATGTGAGVVTKSIQIIDDDGPALALSVAKNVILEGDEEGVVMTISRNTDTATPLALTLHSDHDAQLDYSQSVTIPTGEQSVTIVIKALNNAVTGDTSNVIFTAEANGHAKAVCWLMVSDQTLPDAVISDLSLSANETTVNNVVDLSVTVTNQGNDVLEDAIPINVYLDGVDEPVASLYTPKKLEKGESVTMQSYILGPDTTGVFALLAKVNESQKAKELSYINNVFTLPAFTVKPPYSASMETDKDKYVVGEAVHITGTTHGYVKENGFVEIYFINNGLREVVNAPIGEGGAFSATWHPSTAGDFIAGACYPGQNLSEPMATFGIYGMKTDNSVYTTVDMSLSDVYEGTFAITNQGSLPLTGLQVVTEGTPEGCEISFDVPSTLGANATTDVKFTVHGSKVTEGTEWEHVKLNVSSAEGAGLHKTIYYYCRPSTATLQASIDEINTTMVKGSPKEYQFTIGNRGLAPTGKITLALPPFMKALTPNTMPSLNKGEYATVVLQMTATDEMQINVPVTGQIGINCDGEGLSIPYKVEPVSNQMGTILFDVTDEFTYNTQEKPHLSGADIIVRHPSTGQVVASGKSGDDGTWSATLPEGYYTVSIAAQKHGGYMQNIMVDADREKKVVAFLSYNAIQYSFTVVETEVEDVYEIVNRVEFETRVPAPVVKVDFPKLPYRNQIVNVTVTNEGLIAARDIIIGQPVGNEFIKFELLADNHIDLLKAKESVSIPIRIYVDEDDAFPEAQMAIGVSNNVESSSSGASSGRSNTKSAVLQRPTCIAVQMPVEMPITECDPEIGDLVVVGHQTIMANYYYGDCGSHGFAFPIVGWGGGFSVSGPSSPGGPGKQGPKTTTYFADRLRTILTTGCLNNCERALGRTAKDCFDAYRKCKKGEIGISADNIKDCAEDVEKDCLDNAEAVSTDVDAALDCLGGGIGCLGGCPKALYDCLRDLYDVFIECRKEYERFKREYQTASNKRKAMSEENNEGFSLMIDWNRTLIERREILLGDGDWSALEANDYKKMIEYVRNKRGADGYIIMDDSRLAAKPEYISTSQYDHFLEMYNNTLVFEKTGVASDNMLDMQALASNSITLSEIIKKSKELGYVSIKEMLDDAGDYFNHLLELAEEPASGICSTVTLEFGQSMAMTRQAFLGTLTVFNGNDAMPMKDFKLSLEVRDADGNMSTSRQFQINLDHLDGFKGELTLGSGWTLDAQQTGTATILFIPTKYAAIHEPKAYSFGGTISYIDPTTGLEVKHELNPVTLTVKPSPELDLDYFVQRDVFGDNPFTKEVEPSLPAEFALIINNKGYGDATNVRMTTSQPQIVDNKKGLLIDFELLSSQVNGGDANLSLGQSIANDFGTIAAHSQAYAQWWLLSSLLGHFIDYDVKATHVTSYGNEDLSLLDNVAIHKLIHGFTSDDRRGFLVDDQPDMNDQPDQVYYTDGTNEPVSMAATADCSQLSSTSIVLTVTPSKNGWNYGWLPDPTNGRQRLTGITRQSDGTHLPIDNMWQTSYTLPDGADPIAENLLHFVVNASKGESYQLDFEPLPEVELLVEAISGIPVEGKVANEPVTNVQVRFNKAIEPASFTADDITLVCQGISSDTQSIIINQVDETEYALNLSPLTTNDGFYVLTIHTDGITDAEGFSGTNGRMVSWVQHLSDPATQPRTLHGTVTAAADGLPITGAVVTLTSGTTTLSATTDIAGRYELPVDDTSLTYQLTCIAEGYIHVTDDGVVVSADGTRRDLQLVRGATVLLPSDGVCTFSSTAALDFSQVADHVKAYYGKRHNTQTVTMEEVTQTAPGEGLVLIGTPGQNIDIPEAESVTTALPNNLLRGTAYAPFIVASDNVYVLSAKTGKNKFHRAAQGLLIPQHKAYLLVMDANANNIMEIILDETTLVQLLKGNAEDDRHFSISGLRIEHTAKGVHVVKGKKVLVK